MYDCCYPETKALLHNDYWILIVNRYIFYVLTEFIQFACKHKIVCLYLLAYYIHLLQPLDVDVFCLLKQIYKMLLAKKPRFTIYNFDKANFISLIQSLTIIY